MSEGVRVEELRTSVRRIEYDFETRTGIVHMPWMSCTDMSGCILLFRRIDPHVRAIYTFGGSSEDTMYFRDENDVWSALSHRVAQSDSNGPLLPRRVTQERGFPFSLEEAFDWWKYCLSSVQHFYPKPKREPQS